MTALTAEYPGKSIVQGVYVFNGHSEMRPDVVHNLLERGTALYDAGRIDALLLFSAIWLSREKISRARWDELALPATLQKIYFPHLGEAAGRIVDAATERPLAGALIVATRVTPGGRQPVARKYSGTNGAYRFGGWAERAGKAEYEIAVSHPSYRPQARRVTLRARETAQLDDVRMMAHLP